MSNFALNNLSTFGDSRAGGWWRFLKRVAGRPTQKGANALGSNRSSAPILPFVGNRCKNSETEASETQSLTQSRVGQTSHYTSGRE